MSDAGISCFGKLPYALLDMMQTCHGVAEDYWADAVIVPGANPCLTSIDTIALNQEDLPNSVAMTILHSMNDLFAANGTPLSFSISMSLPLETDADALSSINQAINDCAKLTKCKIGKLHTSRTEGMPTATACVIGVPTGMKNRASGQGTIVIVGEETAGLTPARLYASAAASGIAMRDRAARTIDGPKKDVSGDGLAGALFQLCKRNLVSMTISQPSLSNLTMPNIEDDGIKKNFVDYAASISGIYAPSLRASLFSPRIFGPIVCLIDEAASTKPSDHITIGTFEAGQSSLRLTAS